MECVRTIICKLAPTPEQAAEIDATLAAFAAACDRVADVCRAIHSTNKIEVQHACYAEIRRTFGLSANLAIRAIARTCAALKVPDKAHSAFRPTSADYDARIFRFLEKDATFSLTLLHSRRRIAAALGVHQQRSLEGRKPTSATLVKRRDGQYFLHVQISEPAPEPIPARGFIGVDLGIVNIATDSDGTMYSGADVDRVRRRHNLQRKRLQRRNTKGSKKKIRRMRDKEARFRRHREPRDQQADRGGRQRHRPQHRPGRPPRDPRTDNGSGRRGAESAVGMGVRATRWVHRLQGEVGGSSGGIHRPAAHESDVQPM